MLQRVFTKSIRRTALKHWASPVILELCQMAYSKTHNDESEWLDPPTDGRPGGVPAPPPDPPPLLPPSAIRTANFSPEFFREGGQGGRSRSFHFKKFAKANFLKWCRGGVWGGLPPQESPLPVPCPPRGVWRASPPRNLRYPCLAPAGRRTDGEKSKNELQGSYRPKNLTI